MSNLRVRLSAAVVAVMVVALFYLSFQTVERAQSILQPELERKAATVASSTAGLIDHALALGVPLDRLEGLNAHLERIVAGNPDLAFITLRDRAGKVLYGTTLPAGAEGLPVVALPLAVQSSAADSLAVGLDPSYARQVVSKLWIDLVIVMFVSALVALELIYVGFGTGLYGAIEGLENRMKTIRRGDLRLHLPVETNNEFGRFARTFDERLAKLHETYAVLRQRVGDGGDQVAQRAIDLLRSRFGLGEGVMAAPMSVIAIRAPLFVFMMAEELTRPFLPVYIRELAVPIAGLTPELITSLPMVAFLAVVALAQPLLGGLTDRIGRRRSLMLGTVLGLIGYCASAGVGDLLGFTLARAISACGFALVFVSAQGYVIDSTDIRQRSSGMAVFIGAILVAGLCGPPIGGILADRIGIPGTFVVAGLFAAASFALALLSMPADGGRIQQGPAIRWRDFGTVISSLPLTAIFFLCAMPAKIILVAFCFFLVPLQMEALGATQASTGRMLMIYPIAMVVLVPVFASLADRWQARALFVALGGLIAGLSAFALYLGGNQIALIALMLLGLGVGQAISIAPLSGLVGELGRHLPAHVSETSVYGIFRLIERTGNALGPLVAGVLLGLYGFSNTVAIIGGATAFCAVLFLGAMVLMRQPKLDFPVARG